MSTDSRRERADATRGLPLRTAERLIAERGLAQVSNRQIVEASGQANNSALTYHVGTRTDLIRAITRSHAEPIARLTRDLAERTRGSTVPRDHVALRARTMRLAIIHTCADQELAAADTGVPADWTRVGDALTDAVTGLLLAPSHASARRVEPE